MHRLSGRKLLISAKGWDSFLAGIGSTGDVNCLQVYFYTLASDGRAIRAPAQGGQWVTTGGGNLSQAELRQTHDRTVTTGRHTVYNQLVSSPLHLRPDHLAGEFFLEVNTMAVFLSTHWTPTGSKLFTRLFFWKVLLFFRSFSYHLQIFFLVKHILMLSSSKAHGSELYQFY